MHGEFTFVGQQHAFWKRLKGCGEICARVWDSNCGGAGAERNAGHDRVRRMLVPLRVHLLVQAAGGQVVPSDR